MANLTAMQKLLDRCVHSLNKESQYPTAKELGYSMCLEHVIHLINTEYLEEERQQLVDACLQIKNDSNENNDART